VRILRKVSYLLTLFSHTPYTVGYCCYYDVAPAAVNSKVSQLTAAVLNVCEQ